MFYVPICKAPRAREKQTKRMGQKQKRLTEIAPGLGRRTREEI